MGVGSTRFPSPISEHRIDFLSDETDKAPPAQDSTVHVGSVGAMLIAVAVIFTGSTALQPVTVV
ncbi:hypothetical protein CTA1_6240 [Colletotrichum tanaceti]|uniref:Uncharacterized protein n=1 Tax=Colletotrichum tanaceti TaxID=1306861 RepID=A0A4U6XKR8_9PEZI|nr:hypothetical protein CTA1_6240 [Colletotrichum tanaceti]